LARQRSGENGVFLSDSAGKLKKVKRSGWIRKVGITRDCESVADHSYRLAILGLFFGTEFEMDSAKVVRMCLIHDLAESEIGDLTPSDKPSAKAHRTMEDHVMQKIISSLPARTRSIVSADWKELLESRSAEARLVWELDKFEMFLQSKEYEKHGYDRDKLREFQSKEPFQNRLNSKPRLYPLTI
jgi:putative hydrolases of HD superfamily